MPNQSERKPIFIWENNAIKGIGVENVKIGNTVAIAVADSISWSGTIPEKANLEFSFGIGQSSSEKQNEEIQYGFENQPDILDDEFHFRIRVNGIDVFAQTVKSELSSEWTDKSISLNEFSSQDVKIEFLTCGMLPENLKPYWAYPTIVAENPSPSHVFLIGLDTIAAKHVGWMGSERDTTPFLDSLAAKSIVFTNAHSPSPWTLPSFASVLSGRLPSLHGANRNNRGLSEYEDMLAEIFHRNGFLTAGFVNIPHLQEAGFFQGYLKQWEVHDHPAREALSEAKKWIELNKQHDFFTFIHLFDAHIPYTPPKEYAEKFRDPEYQGPYAWEWNLDAETITENHTNPEVWANFREEDRIQCEALYDAEINHLDDQLKVFFEWLESEILLENSTVIVFADHGEEFGEHGRWEHGHSQYEEQIHVPMFIRLPGQSFGKRVDSLVGTIDIYPTLLELFKFDPLVEPSGISLLSLIHGKQTADERKLVSESTLWGPEIKAVIDSSDKFILNYVDGSEEFYDLKNDAMELYNLSNSGDQKIPIMRENLNTYVQNSLSGLHIHFLAGEKSMSVKLDITSDIELPEPEISAQKINSENLKVSKIVNGYKIEILLSPHDSLGIRFPLSTTTNIKVDGFVDDLLPIDSIILGNSSKTLRELLQDENMNILEFFLDDPVLAFSFPEYNRETDRGVWLWTIPSEFKAHEGELTAEQKENLRSVGYLTD